MQQSKTLAHTRLLFSVDMSYHHKVQPKISELYVLGEKLQGTGRYVKALHAAIARALMELLHLSMESIRKQDTAKYLFLASSKATALPLTTNRAQLAQKCIICERSVYNYIQDLIEIGIIEWVEYPCSWMDTPVSNFILHISKTFLCQYQDLQAGAEHKSDCESTENSKKQILPLSNTSILSSNTKKVKEDNRGVTTSKTFKQNESGNPLSIEVSGAVGGGIAPVDKSQNPVNSANFAFSLPKTQIFESLGTSEIKAFNERLRLEQYVQLLWTQAQRSFWANKTYSNEFLQQACELLAVQFMTEFEANKAARANFIQNWHKEHPHLTEKQKLAQLDKACAKASTQIADPMRAAFLTFNRALGIQWENVAKNGYKMSHPVRYFAQYFDKALHYTHIEQRTHALHHATNEQIQYECVAKHKLQAYMSRALKSYRDFGFSRTLDTLKKDFAEFRAWLNGTPIADKKAYQQKFITQMSFIYEKV